MLLGGQDTVVLEGHQHSLPSNDKGSILPSEYALYSEAQTFDKPSVETNVERAPSEAGTYTISDEEDNKNDAAVAENNLEDRVLDEFFDQAISNLRPAGVTKVRTTVLLHGLAVSFLFFCSRKWTR